MYCETPVDLHAGFPLEPWNVWSSAIIVVFGIAASVMVARRTPWAWWLFLACALLMVNGVGSMLWHGTRTRWANTLDVLPALVFVTLVALIWARRVAPLWQGAVIVAILVFTQIAPRYLGLSIDLGLPNIGWAFSRAIVVCGCAFWLIALTWRHSREAALTGVAAVGLALTALTARSFDGMACEAWGFGSHPLWHVFLSAGAFTAMRMLVMLEPPRTRPLSPSFA